MGNHSPSHEELVMTTAGWHFLGSSGQYWWLGNFHGPVPWAPLAFTVLPITSNNRGPAISGRHPVTIVSTWLTAGLWSLFQISFCSPSSFFYWLGVGFVGRGVLSLSFSQTVKCFAQALFFSEPLSQAKNREGQLPFLKGPGLSGLFWLSSVDAQGALGHANLGHVGSLVFSENMQ